MSLHDYLASQQISAGDPPFAALVFAALRKADTTNAALLRSSFPTLCAEFEQRYHAPGGRLRGEAPAGGEDR